MSQSAHGLLRAELKEIFAKAPAPSAGVKASAAVQKAYKQLTGKTDEEPEAAEDEKKADEKRQRQCALLRFSSELPCRRRKKAGG